MPQSRQARLQYLKDWRKRNPDYERKRRAANPEYFKEKKRKEMAAINADPARRQKYLARKQVASKRRYAANPAASHLKTRKNRYAKLGIDEAEFQRMLSKQGGLCAICTNPQGAETRRTRFNVDHCHVTSKVRGLLCTNCNTKLGWYERNKARVDAYIL